ncbi:uncharacterized protein LOC128218830 [Mya arenaria]|uniref:uncharacterized protein LOC128218830 n=1 Tax=Mya arenaria TaxID=6604 RepID=UPI0022E21C4F|nr:uncharacterized protein LOC128218830 [Mya arenaria]
MVKSVAERIVGLVLIISVIRETHCQSGDPPSELDLIKSQLKMLTNQTARLQTEIQSKNDLTQFLQTDVQRLKSSLNAEQQKNADLERRLVVLESSLKSNQATFSETFSTLNSTRETVTSLEKELRQTRDDVHMTSQWIQTFNATCMNNFQNVTGKGQDARVHFSYRSRHISLPANPTKPLIFASLISKSGSDYNTNTGIFTAPYSGVYLFAVTIAAESTDYFNCYILINDRNYLVEVSAYSMYSSASTVVLSEVKAGDQISVGQCSGPGQIGSYKSSFSGFLLYTN